MSVAERRAAAGARWLDRVEPGWQAWVDPDLIDLTSAYGCVGGQVFADRGDCCGYCYLCALIPSRTQREWLGFEAYEEADHGELREAWAQLLAERAVPTC